nr:hypothetical protein Iba_chr14bCG11440 [Ipomoea batatas]
MAKRQRAASPSPAVMAAMLRDSSYGRTMARRKRWLRLQRATAPFPTVMAEARRRHERYGDDVGEVKQAMEDLTDFERRDWFDISGIPMVVTGRLIGLYGVPFVSGDGDESGFSSMALCLRLDSGWEEAYGCSLPPAGDLLRPSTTCRAQRLFARILTVNVDGDWITADHLGN